MLNRFVRGLTLSGVPVALATTLAFLPTHDTISAGPVTAIPALPAAAPFTATGSPVPAGSSATEAAAQPGAADAPSARGEAARPLATTPAAGGHMTQPAGQARQAADRPSRAGQTPRADGPPTLRSTQTTTSAPKTRQPGTPQSRPAGTPQARQPKAPAQPTAAAARQAQATSSSGPAGRSAAANAGAADLPGWRQDFFDGFDAPIESTKWGRYGWDNGKVGNGAMGNLSVNNVFTSNGTLKMRTKYENGQWTAGGVSSGDFYAVSGGRWEIRAKFPRAKGIGYVFLLYPNDGTWPPEIDIAEGRVNGPQVMGVYHWDADNKQEPRFFDNPDMGGWHTYGVIIEGDRLIYTFDGQPWGELRNANVTTKKLWVGFQTGAMDPNGSAKAYETVDGGVPNAQTPAVSDIEIDHVAHYTRG